MFVSWESGDVWCDDIFSKLSVRLCGKVRARRPGRARARRPLRRRAPAVSEITSARTLAEHTPFFFFCN